MGKINVTVGNEQLQNNKKRGKHTCILIHMYAFFYNLYILKNAKIIVKKHIKHMKKIVKSHKKNDKNDKITTVVA